MAGLACWGLAVVVEAREVVGGSGQGPFDADRFQSAPAEPTHAALLLQDPEYRFDQRLAASAVGASGWCAEPLAAFA